DIVGVLQRRRRHPHPVEDAALAEVNALHFEAGAAEQHAVAAGDIFRRLARRVLGALRGQLHIGRRRAAGGRGRGRGLLRQRGGGGRFDRRRLGGGGRRRQGLALLQGGNQLVVIGGLGERHRRALAGDGGTRRVHGGNHAA